MLPFRARSVVFTSLTALLATPLAAQSSLTGYGPVNARYRMLSSVSSSQIMMGQSQESETKTVQLFTLQVSKTGAALTQVMTLDSATMSSTAPTPMPDMSTLLGMKLTGAMDLDGRVGTSAVTDRAGAPSTSPFASNMRSFLPRLKVGAAIGSSWMDSTSNTSKQNGADVTSTTLTTYTYAGDTTVSGARALKITSTSTGKMSGTGNQQGADFTLGGNTKGRGTFVLTVSGVLLGAEGTSDVSMIVEVPMASMSIPITQKTSTTVSKLP